jgi:hypothetical protein
LHITFHFHTSQAALPFVQNLLGALQVFHDFFVLFFSSFLFFFLFRISDVERAAAQVLEEAATKKTKQSGQPGSQPLLFWWLALGPCSPDALNPVLFLFFKMKGILFWGGGSPICGMVIHSHGNI